MWLKHHFSRFALVALVATLGAAIQWTADSPADGAVLKTCAGATVKFGWNFILQNGENVIDIEFYFGGNVSFAGIVGNHFFSSDPRFTLEPNAVLVLTNAHQNDSGEYVVVVNSHDAKGLTVLRRHVQLVVAVAPAPTHVQTHSAVVGDVVKDVVTGDWNLQLKCGPFPDLGTPPVSPVWQTPSHHVLSSSHKENSTFVLMLAAHSVENGNYTCRLPADAPAVMCLPHDSPWRHDAVVYVDQVDVRFALLEAKQAELTSQLLLQSTVIQQLQSQNANQSTVIHHLQEENINQSSHINHLESENVNQSSTIQQQSSVIQQQASHISHLETENSNQSSAIHHLQEENAKQADELLQLKHDYFLTDCSAVDYMNMTSGVRTVYPTHNQSFTVYCDQITNGSNWTVFQRRQDGSVDFYRTWAEYQRGFGDPAGEFWLGLDALHTLTSQRKYELRVDLMKWDGTKGYATFSNFTIADSSDNYRLHLDSFTGGNAGDSLSSHNNHQFTTKDSDHDENDGNCAQLYHGAWWYYNCHYSNLNADYKTSSSAPNKDGLNWAAFGDFTYSMKFTEMKIRPM